MAENEDTGLQPLDARTRRLLDDAAAPQGLPPALRARLLALPMAAEAEDELTRRYERARAAGLAAARDGMPPAPLGRTESLIAGWIAEARRPSRLPAVLRSRLLNIGRAARKPLPFWLVDLRFATAACLILTLLSSVLVQDASALLGEKAAAARVAGEEWQTRLRETVSSTSEDGAAAARRGWRRGQQIFMSRAEAVRDLFQEKLRQFNQTELGRRLAGERSMRGVKDGPQ